MLPLGAQPVLSKAGILNGGLGSVLFAPLPRSPL
jgi:hypothetical protein